MIRPFSLFFHNLPSSIFLGDVSKIFSEEMMQGSSLSLVIHGYWKQLIYRLVLC
jgi:hypothetical protein